MMRALVIGLAATGLAVTRRLRADGWDVVAFDDQPVGDAYRTNVDAVRAIGATVVHAPGPAQVDALVRAFDLVVPSPLVRDTHSVITASRLAGVTVRSEIDLAAERAQVPIVAVTGTNGKTTVTTLVAAMLEASGVRATPAGNIGRTLLEAVDDDVDVLVAEVSSFQLAFAESFRPRVAVLLAIAEDHLDWHGDRAHYIASKARVFEHQRGDDLLVFDHDDPVAAEVARLAPARRVGVSLDAHASGCYRVAGERLVAADDRELVPVTLLRRALPHDRTNALAAAAAASAVGATTAGVHAALGAFATLPHRVALVGEAGGVRYVDDSKATNPHAAVHAIRSFDSVVLLAGGRNKGLNLSVLAEQSPRIRAVIAFGEAAPEIVAAFAGKRPVATATSMRDAVRAAAERAETGDVVLLSPACASFDAYANYGVRGDDFAAEVRALLAEEIDAR